MKITQHIPDVFKVEVRLYTDNGYPEYELVAPGSSKDGVLVWEGTATLLDGDMVQPELTAGQADIQADVVRCFKCMRPLPKFMECRCHAKNGTIPFPGTRPPGGENE